MNRFVPLTLLAALASTAFAEDGAPDPNARIIAALELPHAANDARRAGVGDDQIKIVLGIGKDKKAENAEIAKALRAGAEASKQNGPIDNFGAFVQSQLDAGLRGQDLAAAIRAEHEARGKGKGAEGHGPPDGKGPPPGAGKGGPPEGMGHEGKGMGAPPEGMGKGGPPPGAAKGPADGAKVPGGGKGAKPGGGQGGGGQGGGQGGAAPKGAGSSGEASKGGGRK